MTTQTTLRSLYPVEPDYLDRALESLAGVPGYPFCEEHDRSLIAEIIHDFPDIDIIVAGLLGQMTRRRCRGSTQSLS
jgi:hypothetical protein